jgi:hypothetical protein
VVEKVVLRTYARIEAAHVDAAAQCGRGGVSHGFRGRRRCSVGTVGRLLLCLLFAGGQRQDCDQPQCRRRLESNIHQLPLMFPKKAAYYNGSICGLQV